MAPFALLATAWAAITGSSTLEAARSWAVYYGAAARIADLRAVDLLVLEPDHAWDPATIRRPGQRILAYLSLGEVHGSRPYYPELAAAPGVLVERNPAWPDAQRVDPRSMAWHDLVVDRLAPALLARGYDGFFLDTLDTGPYLEGLGRYPGAMAAMVQLVRDLKARLPKAQLLANGGLTMREGLAPLLAGQAVESIFTSYQFEARRYAWREPADAQRRRSTLSELQGRYRLPIFDLEYAPPEDAPMREHAAQLARAAGYIPYVSDIHLVTLQEAP